MTKINYDTIKEIARSEGCTIKDLCALAPANDPFYTGRDSETKAAKWFAELWDRFGYTTGVHLRRMHYRIVSQDPPPARPGGQVYENSDKDWAYLNNAGKWARYLKMVDPGAFVDRRNPEAVINAAWLHPGDWDYEDSAPGYGLNETQWQSEYDNSDLYDLPDLPELDSLPHRLPPYPDFSVSGYDSVQQGYHIEIWAEKTTMNDVLLPACQRYGVNLITGAGELSITSVVEFLQRVRKANRPARILYISDYDPAGIGMPISIARKIEYFQRNEDAGEFDIRLRPIVMTSEQVDSYNLPRVPVKDSDKRKANWELDHGRGQVELDALEALYPGELDSIVTEAILDYYDTTLVRRARQAKRQLSEALGESRLQVISNRSELLGEIRSDYDQLGQDFDLTRDSFDELVANFRPQIEAYKSRLDDLLERASEAYSLLESDLEQVHIDTDEEEYSLPSPDLPPEKKGQLYDSNRNYFEQLETYKHHRHNTNGEA